MPSTWITNLLHFLNENGDFDGVPAGAARMARHFGAIVEAVTCRPPGLHHDTGVACRDRERQSRCDGTIVAVLDEEKEIFWECPSCGESGVITDWRGTSWDRRRKKYEIH